MQTVEALNEVSCMPGEHMIVCDNDVLIRRTAERAINVIREQQAEIERLKRHKQNRVYTVVQIRKAFTKAIHDFVKSPLADEMYFHLMGKTEYILSEMAGEQK